MTPIPCETMQELPAIEQLRENLGAFCEAYAAGNVRIPGAGLVYERGMALCEKIDKNPSSIKAEDIMPTLDMLTLTESYIN